jgi:DNA-binding transcriptional regulator YhcF (GntR family)/ADP-ribosylglycohydrolase
VKPVARKTLATQIAEQIRSEIVRGNLRASRRLPSEQELSAQLQVGRPTLREALRILEGQGWVQIKFSGGVFVSDPENLADRLSTYYGRDGVLDLMEMELAQLSQEGRLIPPELRSELAGLREGGSLRQIEELDLSVQQLPPEPSFPFDEPSSLSDIHAARTGPDPDAVRPAPADLAERVRGGILGRCVGTVLGTPVTGWTADAIEQYLRPLGAYPLAGYLPFAPSQVARGEYAFLPHGEGPESPRSKGPLRGVEPEYAILTDTVLSLKVMQLHGWDFSSEDVGGEWLSSLPYRVLLTAERQAYGNLVRGLSPPATATTLNPFREWIGGAVRADFYGYVCPGDPAAAAMLAFRDARVSHTKNGVYGAMFVAAAIAAAFTAGSAQDVVAAGMAQIPRACRLWDLLSRVTDWWGGGADWRAVLGRIDERCAGYKRPHILPNMARLALGLLSGGLDPRATLCTTVMCGADPDCTAAAAGSIVGVRAGASGIPADLAAPVSMVLRTAVLGRNEIQLDRIADEAVRIARECPLHGEREMTV